MNLDGSASLQVLHGLQAGGVKRHAGGFQHGSAHVHRHAAIGCEARGDDAAERLHADGVLVRQALVAHVAGEAARAVAALLHLAAVGVVDHVFKVDALRGGICGGSAHGEDLVRAHAKVAIGQVAVVRSRQAQAALGFVQHNEIVASALHFGEANLHVRIIVVARPRDGGASPMPQLSHARRLSAASPAVLGS